MVKGSAGARAAGSDSGKQDQSVSRTARIVEKLHERIASQELGPGSRLQEANLALEFGTSRTIIREALGALEQRGLVSRVPNRGAVVKRLEDKEVLDIFAIREALEGMLTYKATLDAPDGHWEPFIAEFEGPLAERIAAGDIGSYNDALEWLRKETIRVADNEIAQQFIGQILDRVRVIKMRVTLLPGRAEAGRQMHTRMLRHMAAREAEEAQAVKCEIIRSARELYGRYKALIL